MGDHDKLNHYFNQTVVIGAMNEALRNDEETIMDVDEVDDMKVTEIQGCGEI